MKIKKVVLWFVILFFAVSVGYYIWHDLNKEPTSYVGSVPAPVSTSTPDIKVDVGPVEVKPNAPIPNLDRPINITVSLPDGAKKIAEEKIKRISSELKQNPSLFDNWLVLGIYRKMIGDYEGAKECWEYASLLNPQSYIPFNNLGDLYAHYLIDNKKAEENFLLAVKIAPNQIFLYRSFYEFYHYVLKDDIKAKNILEQGIKANPSNSQDLKNLLDNF